MPDAPPDQLSPDKVLVLDDDGLVLALITEILEGAGMVPLVARTIAEADSLLAQNPVMAFVDYVLLGETGDQWVRRVRMKDAHATLPMVMMTGLDKGEIVRQCFAAGADDFIAKPVEKGKVLEKLMVVQQGLKLPPRPVALPKSVLIATPNEYVRKVLTRLLQNSGFQAEPVSNAEHGLKALEKLSRFDVAVVDLSLPDASVDALLQALQQPERTPFVGLASAAPVQRLLSWEPAGVYDAELELEHVVKHLSSLLGSAPSRIDRRTKPRVPFCAVAWYRFYGGQTWSIGYGYDLSETGIFVRTLTPIPAKRPVEVQFRLEDSTPLLDARGLVIWTNSFGPRDIFNYPYGMGLAFADFPLAEWTRVHEYVQAKLRQKRQRLGRSG